MVFTLWGVAAVFVAIALGMAIFAAQRSPGERHVPAIVALFWHYSVLQWSAGFALVHLFPRLAA